MTTEICDLINGTSQTLYTGDIVCLDATGTQAVLAGAAADNSVIGTVGDSARMSLYPVSGTFPTIDSGIQFSALGGNVQPQSDVAWVSLSLGFTNGSANITSAQVSTNNPLAVGLIIITPYNSSTNATPQIFQVTSNGGSSGSWTAVGTVIAGGGTTFSGTTGSFTCQIGNASSSIGPGWVPPTGWTSSSAFVPGTIVPIVIRGFGRVNISALTGEVKGDLINTSGSSSVVGARTASGSTTAGQTGSFIAITLEAYAARDTALTTAGITGHDSVRAIIGKV
jgi:hypothetical protein